MGMSAHWRRWLAIGVLALASFVPAAAQTGGIAKLLTNKPEVENWNAFGKGETHWRQRDSAVQGGVALHIEIDAKQPNAWDTQAQAVTTRDIKMGDKLLFAFWARAVSAKPAPIPATVQRIDAPYPVMGTASLTIGPDWRLYCVAGTSNVDVKTGKFAGVLQIGTAQQNVDLGPAFLLAARTPAERKLIAGGCQAIQPLLASYVIASPSIAALQKKLEKIMADTHIPGLSIALVRRSGPEWIAGLGKADVAHKVPADADSLFRIGSLSKTFAALSILKLVEEGKLSLDAPLHKVAPGLWFQNKWEATDPVRVVDLIAHTTGWDDMPLRDYTERFGHCTDLGKQLDLLRSPRVSRWRPGTRMSYCNMGPVVAAYVVEQITHQRFEDYVAANFFEPMGMKTATYFRPAARAATLYHSDGKTPYSYWDISGRPAGSINASAKDMARLVAFYLNRGTLDGRQIMPASVIAEMETPTRNWAAAAGLKDGYGLANYTSAQDGRLWHGHDGGVMGGLTNMEYLPQAGVGYFYSINSGNGGGFYQIGKAVRDYLTLDIPPQRTPKPAALPKDAAAFAGWYQPASLRNAFSQGLLRLMGLHLVRIHDDALIVSALGDWKQTYVPVSGRLLRRDNSPIATAALLPPEREGRFIQLGMGNTLQRIPSWLAWLELAMVGWLILALASVVIYLPCWLVWGIWKRHRKPQERWLRLWPLIALLALAAYAGITALAGEDAIELLGNFTLWSAGMWLASVVFAIACLAALFTALTAQGVRRWARRYALAVSLPLVIAAAYFTWWGFVGVPMWM